ncbi:XRE family transcriptional regulator [Bradyrhizobium brasilense]|uniref:XRE family transcriptional regulator n=1 Tax=Bradyrhizobium brasilense TaxID=1419277 RepID=UPI0024B0A39C|nr:XRE family transcriptional regulator [Bradyrhizobium australafricanum]WFU33694.1 XRE family transcriptional regulator [Bradyrhizobium australafricanum]
MSENAAQTGSVIYPQVARALAKLGRDISLARRRRRIAAEDFAQQMGVSQATLHRLERGDPGIALNTLTMAIFVLGRLNAVSELADPMKDDVGMMLTRQEAPRRVQRVNAARSEPKTKADESPRKSKIDDNGYVGF